jgi:hypothetical protein
MTIAAMPEREAHAAVFPGGEILLEAMMDHDAAHWLPLFVRWESGCWRRWASAWISANVPPTGVKYDLPMFRPARARRVARWRGIYASRLFELPKFLLDGGAARPAPRSGRRAGADRLFPAGTGAWNRMARKCRPPG